MYINDYAIEALCNANFSKKYAPLFKALWNTESPYDEKGLVDLDVSEQIDGNSLELKLDSIFQFDKDCEVGISYGKIGISTVTYHEVQGGYSVDFRKLIRKANLDIDTISIHLPPNANFLCQSREFLQIPPDLIGFIYVRSSYARMWINHVTSQVIKPTFRGHITFEFINHSSETQIIKLSDPVIQLLLAECRPPIKPYCLSKNSRYQNQKNQLNKVSII